MRLSACILAGGRGVRLGGVAKGWLEVGGVPIVERTRGLLEALSDDVFVVANDTRYDALGLRVVPDVADFAGQGPLAGLLSALEAAREPDVLVVACDLPALAPAVLALLADAPAAEAVVPRTGGHAEPLVARYARTVAPTIRRHLVAGARKMTSFLGDVTVCWLEEAALRAVDPALASFENINEPDDLSRLAPAR